MAVQKPLYYYIILIILNSIQAEEEFTICKNNRECINEGELCVKGICQSIHMFMKKTNREEPGNLSPACLNQTWPNVENCVLWNTLPDVGLRTVESNSVPPYHVEPYCPFGIGEGYCNSPIEGSSYNCTIFKDMKCPCEPGTEACFATEAGDVLTPYYQYFEMPLYPDPTRDDLPRQMYNHTGLKITVNDPPPGPPGDFVPAIGVHLNGIVMLGPSEANGVNVDIALIPLPCGGHVTPPLDKGPYYHYHKAADCELIEVPGDHGPLVGYAMDGFGIYGYGDYMGMPVLDECHGHFGYVPDTGKMTYHYHASSEYNMQGSHHKPYYVGCLGPSRGKCNELYGNKTSMAAPPPPPGPPQDGKNWCGPGCGFDVCVQPGTAPDSFYEYFEQFPAGPAWLEGLTINDFEK